MELVILSTVATVAILIAELRDLAARGPVTRSTTQAASTSHLASVADLTPARRAVNEAPAAPCPELDRAA